MDGTAYLYDVGSTHGVYLNKKPLRSKNYYPLRDGDIFKIGESTRLYVFNNPNEPKAPEPTSQLEAAPEATW
jgi:pSer/pThr/pTyr-binding forkhead associated (FHA) protein